MTQGKTFPHTLIRASAGTGKTFQLSNRYLGLAMRSAPTDEILATTFTRKAAGEILQRVLSRLAKAAQDGEAARELGRFLGDAALDAPKAAQVLEKLVHQLHRLRISTLDAFFAQLARSFDLELGLPPGWRIIDESADERLRAEAVRDVLAGGDVQETRTLLHLLSKGEVARSVNDQLHSQVRDLYGLFQETKPAAWDAIPRPPRLTDTNVAAAIEALAAATLPEDKHFTDAHAKDLAAARAGDWLTFISKGLGGAIVTRDSTYYNKLLDDGLVEAYQPLVRHAKGVLVGQLADQTRAAHEFLQKFDAHYRRLKLARRALRFEDITLALGRSTLIEQAERLAFRLDTRVSHLLLDEFQDTSLEQWNVLRPLVEDVVAGPGGAREERACERRPPDVRHQASGIRRQDTGRGAAPDTSFFCVGDVKQAIYGWRGGVPELFDVVSQACGDLEEPSLACSRRSSPPVIDTVNRVFERLDGNPSLTERGAAARGWLKGFEKHTTAQNDLPGYVRMVTSAEAENAADQREVTLGYAARETARLVREAPGKSVGVLVRTNEAILTLIRKLAALDVAASEEGGNPLTDSPAVMLLMSLLTLGDHPGDTVARFHVAHSPLGPLVGLTAHDDARQAERLSLAVRQQLLTRGYGATLYRWSRELAEHCGPRDASRLEQLVELGYRFDPEAGLRTRDFIALVEKERIEAPSPADVRVMTIHKAKGLEFDIVVLPQLDYKLSGQTPPVLVGRPSPTAAADLVCRYPNEALRSLLPDSVATAYDAYQERVVRESLCLLYVALTRAIHALYIIVPPAKKPNGTLSGVLHGALVGERPIEAEQLVYEHGDRHWHEKAKKVDRDKRASDTARPQKVPFAVELAQSGKRRRGLERQSPSELARAAKTDLATRMLLEGGQAVNRGSVFHAWFEQIEWLDDGEPSEATLREIGLKSGATESDLAVWLPQFRAKLQSPRLRSVLSRNSYCSSAAAPWSQRPEICADLEGVEPTIGVFRERQFAVRLGDRLLSGTFDRLVLVRGPGASAPATSRTRGTTATAVKQRVLFREAPADTLVAAEVLDFKTDAIPGGDSHAVDQLVARYRPQLSAYRQAVGGIYALPPDRVITRLMLIEADVVVEVE